MEKHEQDFLLKLLSDIGMRNSASIGMLDNAKINAARSKLFGTQQKLQFLISRIVMNDIVDLEKKKENDVEKRIETNEDNSVTKSTE
jgi:hypothetical protein